VKIAHLVPTLHPGGPEIGLSDLAGAAPEAGFEMLVVAIASTSETSELGALRRTGTPVVELGLAPWDPRGATKVARVLREHRVDLVHTHLPPADVIGAAAAALSGASAGRITPAAPSGASAGRITSALRNRIPVVSTLHIIGDQPADRVDRLKRTARILARQRFMARTIAISQVQSDWYRTLSGDDPKLLVVPNGVADPGPVDAAVRARRRASLEIGDDEVLALSTAPMRRDQNHELLLDAVEALPDGLPLVVALAGDGPLRPWLESRVDANPDLADRVRFTHRGADLLPAADIALHTARVGAQPTSVLRAMAMGVPTIATRVGGIPELVTPATGVLVSLSARPLTDALVALTEDAARREQLGAGARARFLDRFEAVGWARRLQDVYTSVLR
jgi:glycosyltransferase involved in cell wall biosynthesis